MARCRSSRCPRVATFSCSVRLPSPTETFWIARAGQTVFEREDGSALDCTRCSELKQLVRFATKEPRKNNLTNFREA